ncbi:MAG: hypothetical protein SPD11_00730 [Sphaerochaetaceae bacterium]|nr:hypothetical protein [Sphaerochaetaceae bacterium]
MMDAVSQIIETHRNTVLMLVDIGVWGFRNILQRHPDRVRNIGIFEDGLIGLSAGLSISGMVPFVYGISPFIVNRAYEQLKLDFAYQKLSGNFITTGASYDFSTLGYSHYCPEDVAALLLLPGIEIVTPATPAQFVSLFNASWNDGKPTYFRLTDHSCKSECNAEFGKATVLQTGKKGLVISVAETLDSVMNAVVGMDVTVLHYSTIAPFDVETLQKYAHEQILICSPFYQGVITNLVVKALYPQSLCIDEIGVPLEILRNYGTKQENDDYCGINCSIVREKVARIVSKSDIEVLE